MINNAFLEFIGDTPKTRVLDFLITGREFDYTKTELCKKAGVSWSTINRLFPKLIEEDIVVETRKVGRATLYKLNLKNRQIGGLVKLHKQIVLNVLKK